MNKLVKAAMAAAIGAGAASLIGGAALAQTPDSAPDLAHLSLVAGYKAAFTCSAHFNAGRSLEQIAGDELNRIYPNYRGALAALPAAGVDDKNKRVSVVYADGAPPRIAQWRPFLGCAQLPAGADAAAADNLRPVSLPALALTPASPWPDGDYLGNAYFADSDAGAPLKAAASRAFDGLTYGQGTETTAVVIVKDGDIVFEDYRDGFDATTPQRTWSVAKSIAATVVGAAVRDAIITTNEPVGLAAWSAPGDPRRAITIADVMRMSSGLDAAPAGNRTDDIYFGGGRVIDHAITRRAIAAPGKRWYYANNDTMILMRALRERMGDDAYLNYPFERILRPLGMRHTFLETDWNGDFVMSSQVWTTARDLARLGLLYLNNGEWNGEQLLPDDWAAFVATPAADQPPPRANGSPRPGYGAQFWLFDESWGLPDGTYAAMGNRGQYLVIIPQRNMLVIRRGFDDNGGARFDIAQFASDVAASLP